MTDTGNNAWYHKNLLIVIYSADSDCPVPPHGWKLLKNRAVAQGQANVPHAQ